MISLIVAKDKKGVIGKAGGIPWRLPADVAFFRATTMMHPVIMGKKTFESINRPLPGRTNIIITSDSDWSHSGCVRAASVAEAISLAEKFSGKDEIFVIGGGRVYKDAMSLADRLYVTEVDVEVRDGDTFFPVIDRSAWRETSREDYKADDKNQHNYSFVIYERIKKHGKQN